MATKAKLWAKRRPGSDRHSQHLHRIERRFKRKDSDQWETQKAVITEDNLGYSQEIADCCKTNQNKRLDNVLIDFNGKCQTTSEWLTNLTSK